MLNITNGSPGFEWLCINFECSVQTDKGIGHNYDVSMSNRSHQFLYSTFIHTNCKLQTKLKHLIIYTQGNLS